MKITAEISLYPLQEEYESTIIGFIKKLQSRSQLEVSVNGMSTQIRGEMPDVFAAIESARSETFREQSQVAAVVKYLGKSVKPGEQVSI